MVANDLLDDNICEIFYWMRFVDRYEFVIFGKTIYYNVDTIIAGIIDKVPRFE